MRIPCDIHLTYQSRLRPRRQQAPGEIYTATGTWSTRPAGSPTTSPPSSKRFSPTTWRGERRAAEADVARATAAMWNRFAESMARSPMIIRRSDGASMFIAIAASIATPSCTWSSFSPRLSDDTEGASSFPLVKVGVGKVANPRFNPTIQGRRHLCRATPAGNRLVALELLSTNQWVRSCLKLSTASSPPWMDSIARAWVNTALAP